MRFFARAALLAGFVFLPQAARAADTPPATMPRVATRGLAVLAIGDAAAVAWPLARGVYSREVLRPASLEEARARVLAGEPPPAGSGKDLADLSETRAAIRGDDAPSRQLLASIATSLYVRGILVVMTFPDAPPQARVFVADASAFDAARYAPAAADGGDADWSGVILSLERGYGAGAPTSTPSRALSPTPLEKEKPKESETKARPFYASPWFWGAIGAAALGGTALYFATRDNSSGAIHLQLQVPK